MKPRANTKCLKCKAGTLRSTCSEQEFNRARMIARACDMCGSVQCENLPVRSSKPDERFRAKLRGRAQKMGNEVKAGALQYSHGYWVPIPVEKRQIPTEPKVVEGPDVVVPAGADPVARLSLPNLQNIPVRPEPFVVRFDDEEG